MAWKFIENNKRQLLDEIKVLLAHASEASFAVAFVRTSGVKLIAPTIERAIGRGATVRLLFGLDWALTEATAIRALIAVGVHVKCYVGPDSFHPKGYVFGCGSKTTAIIGSANLSSSGLTSGREWSALFSSAAAGLVVEEFDRLWRSGNARLASDDILNKLQSRGPPSMFRHVITKEDRLITPSVSFVCKVTRTFLEHSTHPITVLKKQVRHEELRSLGFDEGKLTVIYGNSAPLRGYIHSANEGSRRYYQIRMNGPAEHPLFALPLDCLLNVQLEGSPGSARVILTPASRARVYN